MRKVVLLSLLVALISFSASAQVPEVKLGAKAGANFSNLSISEVDGRTRFHLGALAEVFFTDQFSLQPEILYSAQGASGKDSGVKIDFNFDYILVPVMAKFYVLDGLNIQAGPQIGFLTKGEWKESFEGNSVTIDVKDTMNSIDFGVNLGAGYELPMGVFFDARYNLGLSKINKESESDMDDLKNRVFQVSVGYKF